MEDRPVPNPVVQAFYVARQEAKAMLLSVRAVFMVVVYGLITGSCGACSLWADEKSGGKLQGLADGLDEATKQKLIEQAADEGVGVHLAETLLSGDLPILIYGVLYFSTFAIPGLVLLVGFNRVADDIQSRFTRYLLQRVHRGAYLAGKIFGHWLACFIAIVIAHVILLGVASSIEQFDVDATLPAMPRIWLAMAIFLLAYVGYTTLFGVISPGPYLALLLGSMGLIIVWVASWVLKGVEATPFDRFWIGQWDDRLWSLDPKAVAVYLAYAAAFTGLAHLVLRKRDL